MDLGFRMNWDSPYATQITIENDSTISGYRKSNGWAKDQHVYFVAQFSKAFKSADLFEAGKKSENIEVNGAKTRIVANFSTAEKEQILVKVALSSASVEGAKKNLKAELPAWDFDAAVKSADREWQKVLSQIEITGSEVQKEIFYTNLYHLYLTPSLLSDVDGMHKGADGKNHKSRRI